MQPDPFSERMASAARHMEGATGSAATMEMVVELGLQLVPTAHSAAISVVRKKHLETPTATDDRTRRIDELQAEHREGPCLDAIHEVEGAHSGNLATDSRWPAWGPAVAREAGVHSLICFRLFTHGGNYGALTFYSTHSDAFDDDDREHGLAVAAHAAIALAAATAVDQFRAGMDHRTVIGQAQGIVMERFSIDAVQSFALLTRLSSHSNRKLREVALDIVITRDVPTIGES